jgi:hypothetical protein
MKAPVFTTVGELIAILFDETRKLGGLKTRERRLLVAYLLNDLLQHSSFSRATRYFFIMPRRRADSR